MRSHSSMVSTHQQMCFQSPCTIVRGAQPRHSFFLSHGNDDPPRAMAGALMDAMSDGIGTVFVWYEAFEKTRNSEMAEMFPEYAEFFEEVNRRTVDLMKIFSDNLYVHPEFKGSSIKKCRPWSSLRCRTRVSVSRRHDSDTSVGTAPLDGKRWMQRPVRRYLMTLKNIASWTRSQWWRSFIDFRLSCLRPLGT